MRDLNIDWCFEGGCTHMEDTEFKTEDELDTMELEVMYREPCVAMFD